MKQLLIFLFALSISFAGVAQSGLNKQTLTDKKTEALIKNTLSIDSTLIPPIRDTNFIAEGIGRIVIRPQDSLPYLSTGIQTPGARHWILMLGSGGGGGSGAVWGVNITGNISAQTDLQAEFLLKQNLLPAGTSSQYWDASGGLQTFPAIPAQMNLTSPNGTIVIAGTYPNITAISGITNLNQLTNGPGYITANQPISISGDATAGPSATALNLVLATVNSSPGSCTNCSLTVDAKGRVSVQSSGTGSNLITSVFTRTGAVVAASGDYTAAQVTNAVSTLGSYTNPSWLVSIPWTKVTNPPTTIATYGITDNLVNTFNTRSGAVTLTSSDVTTALTYTPVTNARTLTINGTTFDLTANRSWTITGTGYTAADTGYSHILASVFLLQKVTDSMKIVNNGVYLQKSNNLSDLASASVARSNLGLGTAAVQNSTAFAQVTNNLSDLNNLNTARGNLGVVGGTPGKLVYYTANNSLYTIPILYDSVNMILLLSQSMHIGPGSTSGSAGLEVTFQSSDLGQGLLVDGTASSTGLGISINLIAPAGAGNVIRNTSNGANAIAFENIISNSYQDASQTLIQIANGGGFQTQMHGVLNSSKWYLNYVSPINAGLGSFANTTRLLSMDSLGRLSLLQATRLGTSTDSVLVKSTGGEVKYVLQGSISGGLGTLNRVGLIDSLTRVANGIQISGNSIIPQTANGTAPGFLTSLGFLTLDSINKRTIKVQYPINHLGVGLWSGYSSTLGDAFNLKNLQVSSDLTLVAQSDSSLLWSINASGNVVTKTGTQTIVNKTITAPLITSVQLETTSTSGYVWTASDASGHGAWAASAGGGGGSQNLGLGTITATTIPITISGGTGITLPISSTTAAGLLSAAKSAKLDSNVVVAWTGRGKSPLRVSYKLDSLTFRGDTLTGSNGIAVTYTGTNDMIAFNAALNIFTTTGDMIQGGSGGSIVKTTIGANGSVWTSNGTSASWQPGSGTGTVTTVSITPTVSPFFTTTVTNASTAPAITITSTPAGSYTVLQNATGSSAVPSYGTLVLASNMFANQGTPHTILHGNNAGIPSWGVLDIATEVTGTMNAAQEPAHTGDVTNAAGQLGLAIGTGKVTNAMLAGSIDLTAKVAGILPGTNGGNGVNNGTTTFTRAGNVTFAGAFASTFNFSALTNVTFPTSGTLLTATGNGSSLTGIPISITGTANQVIASGATGAVVLSLPQSIAPASSPTFTDISLTGMPSGSIGDNFAMVPQGGGPVKFLSFTNLMTGLSNNMGIASGNYTPTITVTANGSGGSAPTIQYIRSGSTVLMDGIIVFNPVAGNTITTVEFPPPIASTFTGAYDAIGSGTAIDGGSTGFTSNTIQLNANPSTNRIVMSFHTGTTTSTHSIYFHAAYTIH